MTMRAIFGLPLLALLTGCAGLGGAAPTLQRTFVLEGVGAPRQDVGVPGRIDHCAYDPATERLFVAALENGSVEVLDLKRGTRVRSITGLGHPQGAAVVPQAGCVVVGCGDGKVFAYDTRTLVERAQLDLGRGADNVRCDAAANLVYVTYGNVQGGAIAVIDPTSWTKQRDIAFRSRPESFQLAPRDARLFANIPDGLRAMKDGAVAIVDRTTGQTTAEVALAGRARNYPMAFDADHERLFIVSRRPAKLIMIDTRSKQVLASADCSEDSDDLFYDARTGRILVIGGGFRPDFQDPGASRPSTPADEMGAIDVFVVTDARTLERVGQTPTAPHARTGLFVPQRRMLYLAVPPHGARPPEIREYRVAD